MVLNCLSGTETYPEREQVLDNEGAFDGAFSRMSGSQQATVHFGRQARAPQGVQYACRIPEST